MFLQTIAVPTFGSNSALWSLANEGWYYVLCPLLFAPLMTNKTTAARVGLFLLAIALLGLGYYLNKKMVLLFSAWLLGASVRAIPRPLIPWVPVSWALAVAGLVAYPVVSHFMKQPHWVPAFGMANLLLTCSYSHGKTMEWAKKFNIALAGFSFSLYLIHLPVLHFILSVVGKRSNPQLSLPLDFSSIGLEFILVLVIVPLAWGFGRITESRTGDVRRFLNSRIFRQAKKA